MTKRELLQTRRVTLEDVAQAAGVSRALVSIVMRKVPGASATTRERIFRIAEELGYRPDARAQLLARRNSKLIGVVFGMNGSYPFEVLDGLYAAAERRDYELILSALTPGRGEQRTVDALQGFRLDALIMLAPQTERPLLAGSLPLVVIGWQVDDESVDVVRTSDRDGMALAVTHLVETGHRRIAHIDGGDNGPSIARRNGYLAAMERHGLGEYTRVLRGGESQSEGLLAVQALLESDDELPTALIGFNDEVAIMALGMMTQHGISVPDDVSIIGWDDSPLASLPHINLSSVRQDLKGMADHAIDVAISRIEGREPPQREIVLDPELVLRGTTAPVPGGQAIASPARQGRL